VGAPRTRANSVQAPGQRDAMETAAPPVAEPETLCQFFRAQVDDEIVIDQPVTLLVEVSAEELTMAAGRAKAGGGAKVDPSRKISLAVLGRKNVVVDGDSRANGRAYRRGS
jgi:hypothetical protein